MDSKRGRAVEGDGPPSLYQNMKFSANLASFSLHFSLHRVFCLAERY